MPNSMSEVENRKIINRTTTSRKLVCKIYYKKVIRKRPNINRNLTNDEDCQNISPSSEICGENKCDAHISMWSKFNKGIIYTTKGLRKAENVYINAVLTGKLDDVAKLLQSGVNPNVKDEEELTALHIATERGDLYMDCAANHWGLGSLDPKTCGVDRRSQDPVTLWGIVYLSPKCILSAKDVIIDATTSNGDTPLITAVRCNRENLVQLLLNHGANPNVTNYVGTTPLLIACSSGFVDIAKNLLIFHANPNCQDAFGDVPLVKAMIEHPNKMVVWLLLKYGANPNHRTMRKHPLFVELALHCTLPIHMQMIDIMIRSGVNLNIRSSISKYTALHIASIGGNIPLVKHLLEMGANMELKDYIGRTPMDVAEEHGHVGLVRVYKNWKKVLEDIKKSESDAKKSALANKEKNRAMSESRHSTAARAVTFSSGNESNELDSNYTE